MKAAATIRIATIAACLGLTIVGGYGCVTAPGIGYIGGWDTNVSEKTQLWGNYTPDGVYVLRKDVLLLDWPDRTNGLALLPGMDTSVPPDTVRAPTTAEDYRADPKRRRQIRGIVASGTRLRVTTLRAKGNIRDHDITRHYVKGRILRGPYQNTVVDLQALSLYRRDPDTGRTTLVGTNPDFLKPLAARGKSLAKARSSDFGHGLID